jgi:hypothetical protein
MAFEINSNEIISECSKEYGKGNDGFRKWDSSVPKAKKIFALISLRKSPNAFNLPYHSTQVAL